MNLFSLVLASFRFRKVAVILSVLLCAFAVTAALSFIQISTQLDKRLKKDLAGVDMVVGAKGSGLQLVLSTLLQADIPTGNMPYAEAQKLLKRGEIKQAIPLALGDRAGAYRIVGTNPDYIDLYKGKIEAGAVFVRPFEAVIGADVERLEIGDTFQGSHGLGETEGHHHHEKYIVTGRLTYTGTVLDRLVLTSVESVLEIHGQQHHDDGGHEEDHDHHGPPEITAYLVKLKSPAMRMNFMQYINRNTDFQAALPALEVLRMMNIFGLGQSVMLGFALLLGALVGLSLWAGLSAHLQGRLYDMALLKIMGLPSYKVALLPLIESYLVGFTGLLLGFAFTPPLLSMAAKQISFFREMGLGHLTFTFEQLYIVALVWVIATLAALLPALKSHKLSPLSGEYHAA
ncbi:MAG: FtsX-like permease family protein [Alphaproteobacteria bacterium]|nr:FtsX-like permease family protein [Alphaproteobacteria bacterium]